MRLALLGGLGLVALVACSADEFSGSDSGADASGDVNALDARADVSEGGSGDAAPCRFCDDFDQETDGSFPKGKWDSFSTNGGTLGLAPSDASAPNAALFSMPASDAATYLGPVLSKHLTVALDRFDFDLDVMLDSIASNVTAELVRFTADLDVGSPVSSWSAILRYVPAQSQTQLAVFANGADGGNLAPPGVVVPGTLVIGKWYHVTIHVKPGTIDVAINGSTQSASSIYPATVVGMKLDLENSTYAGNAATKVRFDDVAFR